MIKQPNFKLIGTFVVVALLGLATTLGYFLRSKFNDNGAEVVMYFDESVKGLDIGSAVLFKGVKIGEVTHIHLEADLQTMQFLIPVNAKIYSGKSLITNMQDRAERLDQFIKSGLRAQLSVGSMITGQLVIELDMHPDSKVALHPQADGQFEIPTIPSPFSEISKSLQVMPVAKIAQDVSSIAQSLNADLPPLIKKISGTLDTVDTILKDNSDNTAVMVEQFGSAAQTFNALLTENAGGLASALESFNAAAQSLRNLTDYLQMYPNSLIIGKE
jgi:paraquat-inducible protein B